MTTTLKLTGARVVDPAAGESTVRDVYLRDRVIVAAPAEGDRVEERALPGHTIMAGGVDIHTHIGGGKINIARGLLPDQHACGQSCRVHRFELPRADAPLSAPAPDVIETGVRYAQMGYTSCFEPAMVPADARHAHAEMADIPVVDKGAYAMLGNDDFLLELIAKGAEQQRINDFVAMTLHHTQALAIKVVNPGGISAFKFNQRKLDVDEEHVHYRITPRRILQVLSRAIHEIGLAHPLHIHASNLGVAGNVDSTLATIDAAEGLPIHLTHVQFNAYGKEGDKRFSSGAARIAEAVNRNRNVSIDVGQVMFGQTVTASGDTQAQYRGARLGSPRKSVLMDLECEAGCGVVPFRYQDQDFVNALQWAIGLELFLLVDDPWRVFLTTDHPNGGPFTSYPHLIRLLTDRTFRNEQLQKLHPDAQKATVLASITREYTLEEIAIMSRTAPARSLGLNDIGHLGAGASADVAVYRDDDDRERMFAQPELVFKGGELVIEGDRMRSRPVGRVRVARPDYDRAIERDYDQWCRRHLGVRGASLHLGDDELAELNHGVGSLTAARAAR